MSECVLLPLRSLDLNVVMVSPTHRDHDHYQTLVNHVVDQAVAFILVYFESFLKRVNAMCGTHDNFSMKT